jgi:hypothetical protein
LRGATTKQAGTSNHRRETDRASCAGDDKQDPPQVGLRAAAERSIVGEVEAERGESRHDKRCDTEKTALAETASVTNDQRHDGCQDKKS